MVDISYSLETLSGKHGGLLEVVEAIVSDGRLIMILTDEDVLQRRDAPFELVRESLKFPEDVKGLENLMRELGR
jgi:hypothetical protein